MGELLLNPSAGITSLYRVQFVCRGNICRSPYAELGARAARVPGVEFSSSGIQAMIGWGVDGPMAAELALRGIPTAHTARQLTREVAEDADLLIAMGSSHREWVLEEWPDLGRRAFVIGHVARELDGMLPQGLTLDELVPYLWAHRTARPRGEDEVADPWGGGGPAASRAAHEIDQFLKPILTALAALGRS